MGRLTVVGIAVALVAGALAGCGGPPPELEVSYRAGADKSSFGLVNASAEEWSDVQVLVRGLRPDGIESECAEKRIEAWSPGDAQTLPRCGDEKTLITIETGGQRAFFVLGGDTLYRKLGRREIPLK